jgi:hypothetical protein
MGGGFFAHNHESCLKDARKWKGFRKAYKEVEDERSRKCLKLKNDSGRTAEKLTILR